MTRGLQEAQINTTANVTTIIYGENTDTPPTFSSSDRVKDIQNFVDGFCRHLLCGTFLDKEIDGLSDMMADQGSDKASEIIILSDGQLFDMEKTSEKLELLSELYPKMNLSIQKIGHHNDPEMGELRDDLENKGINVDFQEVSSTSELISNVIDKINPLARQNVELSNINEASSEIQADFKKIAEKLLKLEELNVKYDKTYGKKVLINKR